MVDQAHFLRDLVVVYGISALVVYLFQKVRQSTIVGFLVTGVLVGPSGLRLVNNTESVTVLAEIGVMLLLFSLGLEFSIKKLMQIRNVVFGTGGAQVLLTMAVVLGVTAFLGVETRRGVVLGFLVALSSTGIVIKLLLERGEMDSIHGRVSLGVLIFQDLCVVPMIVLVPLLAERGSIWIPLLEALGKAVLVLAVVVLLARYALPAFLRHIMETRSKEMFVIASLWILLGTAWSLSLFGFSLALGAFLSGLTVSESEYSHQIFADIRPFRDGLNSLFFISIGMLVDLGFIWSHAGSVLGVIAAVVAGKALLNVAAILVTRLPIQVALMVGLSLAQIGEFSFVLLQSGMHSGLVPRDWYQFIIASAVVSMLLTPALIGLSRAAVQNSRLAALMRLLGSGAAIRALDGAAELMHDHVLICGLGVTGRNIVRVLRLNKISYVILELNPRTVRQERSNGEPIFFGDCTDPGILSHAGVARARIIVFALSDPLATRLAVKAARELNPGIVILARNKYLAEIDELYDLGATEVISEEFESSLELLTRILRVYHFPRDLVAREVNGIRRARYGIFRHLDTTVPRLRLSTQLDVYLETIKIKPDSPLHGKKILDTGLRQESGALILGIVRESETLNNPDPSEILQVGDLLLMSGTKEQLKKALKKVHPPPGSAA